MIGLDVISAVIFFALVSIMVVRDRKNIEFSHGIILKRWRGGIERIDRFVAKHRGFLHYMGLLSIVIGILAGIVGVGYITYCAVTLTRCFGLVLPSVGGVEYPGPVVSIPFWYWLVAIFVIVATHESMHAVLARAAKVPVKSYGLILLLALPIGAFVDPDNKKIKKLAAISKMKIFAVGSFANFITAGLMLLLILVTNLVAAYFVQPMPSGVEVQSTVAGSPADAVKLSGIIISVNGNGIKSSNYLHYLVTSFRPYENINITTTSGTFKLKTAPNPINQSLAYIGINTRDVHMYKFFPGYLAGFALDSLISWNTLLSWIGVLSVAVGVVNMLPIKPLDGGLMFQEIWDKIFKKKAKLVGKIVSITLFALIIFNLFVVWALRTFVL